KFIFTFTVAGFGESVSPLELTSTFGSNSTSLQPSAPTEVVNDLESEAPPCASTFRTVVWPPSQLLGIVIYPVPALPSKTRREPTIGSPPSSGDSMSLTLKITL